VGIDSGRCALQALVVDLLRLDADSLSDSGEEQVQRLLEGIAAMLLSE